MDTGPGCGGGTSVGNSVPREMHAAAMDWPMVQTGKPVAPAVRATTSTGNGLMRPLEAAAKKAGVQILLEHKMTNIYREGPNSGRVLGIAVDNKGAKINIRARKAVIVATGGSTGNVNFRMMFDPRLTEEYCGLAGMPWSDQDGSGEIAAMAVGASLWGLYNRDRRIRHDHYKGGLGRVPVRLQGPDLDAGQPRVQARPRVRPQGGRLAECHPREHAGQPVLR